METAILAEKIGIGCDHNGLQLKKVLKEHLLRKGYRVDDIGTATEEPIDYPDIGATLAELVRDGKYDLGILICGTGAGMAIAANKVPGVRAVCVSDPYTAERARASNNAQIITLGAQVVGPKVATKLVDIWLESKFQGGDSARKVAKIDQLDHKYRR